MKLRIFTCLLTLLALAGCMSDRAVEAGPEPVLVFGATGPTGIIAVQQLREKGIPVTAFVRPTSKRDALQPLGVTFVVGDALSLVDVERAMSESNFGAVVSTIGGRPGQPRPDFYGVKNMVDAATKYGVKRMVLVSSIGAGDESRAKPPADAGFFKTVLHEKTLGEDYLIASGMDYTILRPGGLRTEPATGNSKLSESPAMGMVHRADVGAQIAKVLGDPASFGKVYYLIDPNLKRGEER